VQLGKAAPRPQQITPALEPSYGPSYLLSLSVRNVFILRARAYLSIPRLSSVTRLSMSYTLHSVALSDIEDLVRSCDHPAMQENPLHMTMFPTVSPESREEEIMWHVSSFLDSFEKSSGAYFRKVCHNGNTPVGFALWSLDQTCPSLRKESR
jgi:hypothetical protein